MIFGVNADLTPQAHKEHVERENLPIVSVHDRGLSRRGPIATRWRLEQWPTLYVIDHAGRIAAKANEYESVATLVEDLVRKAETAGGAPAPIPSTPDRPQPEALPATQAELSKAWREAVLAESDLRATVARLDAVRLEHRTALMHRGLRPVPPIPDWLTPAIGSSPDWEDTTFLEGLDERLGADDVTALAGTDPARLAELSSIQTWCGGYRLAALRQLRFVAWAQKLSGVYELDPEGLKHVSAEAGGAIAVELDLDPVEVDPWGVRGRFELRLLKDGKILKRAGGPLQVMQSLLGKEPFEIEGVPGAWYGYYQADSIDGKPAQDSRAPFLVEGEDVHVSRDGLMMPRQWTQWLDAPVVLRRRAGTPGKRTEAAAERWKTMRPERDEHQRIWREALAKARVVWPQWADVSRRRVQLGGRLEALGVAVPPVFPGWLRTWLPLDGAWDDAKWVEARILAMRAEKLPTLRSEELDSWNNANEAARRHTTRLRGFEKLEQVLNGFLGTWQADAAAMKHMSVEQGAPVTWSFRFEPGGVWPDAAQGTYEARVASEGVLIASSRGLWRAQPDQGRRGIDWGIQLLVPADEVALRKKHALSKAVSLWVLEDTLRVLEPIPMLGEKFERVIPMQLDLSRTAAAETSKLPLGWARPGAPLSPEERHVVGRYRALESNWSQAPGRIPREALPMAGPGEAYDWLIHQVLPVALARLEAELVLYEDRTWHLLVPGWSLSRPTGPRVGTWSVEGAAVVLQPIASSSMYRSKIMMTMTPEGLRQAQGSKDLEGDWRRGPVAARAQVLEAVRLYREHLLAGNRVAGERNGRQGR